MSSHISYEAVAFKIPSTS